MMIMRILYLINYSFILIRHTSIVKEKVMIRHNNTALILLLAYSISLFMPHYFIYTLYINDASAFELSNPCIVRDIDAYK